ncbi:hypothetical protein [Alteromonas sp. a30]|uniref:hypothetical protein n=1 Tax=Alteromonas sp. a30 TaxID=2730917 RepID=UPI002282D949|nr:hypothetical protein [Alteromonas sp. a30]MCY7295755.1 hypothetical protein [Alteromonas sp. a30]
MSRYFYLLCLILPCCAAANVNVIDVTFCERIQNALSLLESENSVQRVDSSYTCEVAPRSWLFGLRPDDAFSMPIIIKPKALLNKRKASSENVKPVLLLSPKWSDAYDEASATIIDQFTNKGLLREYILFNYQGQESQADNMIKQAERSGVELIFSVGSAVTEYMTQTYSDGSIPVVTACSKDPYSIGQVDPAIGMSQNNIAYTSLNISVETQVSYLKEQFLYHLKKIVVIYDQANTSSIITQVKPLENYLKNDEFGIELDKIKVDLTRVEETLYQPMERVVDLSKDSGDTVFLITGSTELFNLIGYVNYFAGHVPILSVTPSHVNEGDKSVFVSIGVSFRTNAKLAADYGARIIQGLAKTETLPVGVVSMPDISINFLRKPSYQLKVPFSFFEDSSFIYNYHGEAVRRNGATVVR